MQGKNGKKRSRKGIRLGISGGALGAGLLAFFGRQAQAEPVNLGDAGPSNWALEYDDLSVAVSGGSTINGNVGVWAGELGLSDSSEIQGNFVSTTLFSSPSSSAYHLTLNGTQVTITGSATLDGGTIASYTGGASSSQIQGGVVSSYPPNALLNQAYDDAANANDNATSLSPTQSVAGNVINITSGTTTITGTSGVNVININSLNVSNGANLVLSAPTGGSFVINDSGAFTADGHITVAGGLDGYDVLYNMSDLGGGETIELDGTVDGILLAGLDGSGVITLDGGTLNGELIVSQSSYDGVSLTDGAGINDTDVMSSPSVPEPASLSVLSLGSAGLLLRRRRRAK